MNWKLIEEGTKARERQQKLIIMEKRRVDSHCSHFEEKNEHLALKHK